MAATCTVTGSAPIGIFGIQNDYFVQLGSTTGTVYKHQFRIKLTINGTVVAEYDVASDSDKKATLDPFSVLRDNFFKTEFRFVTGNDPLFNGYALVKIEVGEFYASTSTGSGAFRGYDTNGDLYFANAFDNDSVAKIRQNYTSPNILTTDEFDATIIPMLRENLSTYATREQSININFFSEIKVQDMGGVPYTVYPVDIELRAYDGVDLVHSLNESVSGWNAGIGYYYYDAGWYVWKDVGDSVWDRMTVRIRYVDDVEEPTFTVYSEMLTVNLLEEDNRADHYYIQYFNKFGAMEEFNFVLKNVQEYQVDSGKILLQDRIDRSAASVSIKTAEGERKRVGQSMEKMLTLNSDWLDAGQRRQIPQMLATPQAVMFNTARDAFPVLLETRSFKITDIRNELMQISMKVRLANRQKILSR